ncbi:MAG: integrin alpha, partial [Planctomycetota bacterium]
MNSQWNNGSRVCAITMLASLVLAPMSANVIAEEIILSDVGSLNGTPGTILIGIEPGDRLGGDVENVGDVNGDNRDDFLISAGGAEPNSSSSGQSYLILGDDELP